MEELVRTAVRILNSCVALREFFRPAAPCRVPPSANSRANLLRRAQGTLNAGVDDCSPSASNALNIAASPPAKIARKNVGGASKLTWFNVLAGAEQAEPRANLVQKIGDTKRVDGCLLVEGFGPETRPVMDKKWLAKFRETCPDAPARFSPYHIALLKARVLVPAADPPPYPAELRLVKQKRSSKAADGNEKSATWVASHLCHNHQCVDVEHLRWEPSWFNRLRDNCPGGDNCPHRPDACINPHRPAEEELVDWTKYL